MDLCACVREEVGDGESAGAQALSDTFRYINLAESFRSINLAELAVGLVAWRRTMYLCACVRDRCTCVHVCARILGTGRVRARKRCRIHLDTRRVGHRAGCLAWTDGPVCMCARGAWGRGECWCACHYAVRCNIVPQDAPRVYVGARKGARKRTHYLCCRIHIERMWPVRVLIG